MILINKNEADENMSSKCQKSHRKDTPLYLILNNSDKFSTVHFSVFKYRNEPF